MGMISEAEAQVRCICVFCENPIDLKILTSHDLGIYKEHTLCPECYDDFVEFDGNVRAWKKRRELENDDQLEFKLSSKSPIPIDVPGATNMGWLVLNHPKVFIGSHITCENYGLTVKFTIIPPTREAGERIVNTMRIDREKRNRKLRPGHKGNAPSRYTL